MSRTLLAACHAALAAGFPPFRAPAGIKACLVRDACDLRREVEIRPVIADEDAVQVVDCCLVKFSALLPVDEHPYLVRFVVTVVVILKNEASWVEREIYVPEEYSPGRVRGVLVRDPPDVIVHVRLVIVFDAMGLVPLLLCGFVVHVLVRREIELLPVDENREVRMLVYLPCREQVRGYRDYCSDSDGKDVVNCFHLDNSQKFSIRIRF